MTKIQNHKHVLVIDYCDLRFICNSVLVIWNLKLLLEAVSLPISFLMALIFSNSYQQLSMFSVYQLTPTRSPPP